MRADLAHLFGTSLDDVLDGRVGVRHALQLLEHAPDYEDSLIREKAVGSRELAHWTVTTSAVTHLSDLMAALLAGLSKKPAEQLRFKRPTADVPPKPRLFAATIADFNVDRFMGKFSN